MPFVANTPESLLGRSDSKDPGSTCRGITSSGRPCRRPVPRPASASLRPRADAAADLCDESLYCWQHKEQASRSARSSPGPRRHAQPILEQRSSLDTLADRLGLIDVAEGAKAKRREQAMKKPNKAATPDRPTKPRQKQSLRFCFCFTIPIDEVHESPPPRPRPGPRPVQQPHAAPCAPVPGGRPRISGSTVAPSKPSHVSKTPSNTSQTARLKELIPDSLDAATASALMAELCRPYAEAEEAGYIYMFWLTPASAADAAPAPVAAARSLLAPPTPSTGDGSAARSRRPSDVVSRFADPDGGGRGATMLLKIGRAANVQRRMNQWQRQCGHDIEMLRYYPYLAASEAAPRTTPHCRRVERLIHLELAGRGLRADLATCAACGRDHREWFRVGASREAIRTVDEVIRRWVDWDEATVG